MAFIFAYIGNDIIPIDDLIFFRGVGIPSTRCMVINANNEWYLMLVNVN